MPIVDKPLVDMDTFLSQPMFDLASMEARVIAHMGPRSVVMAHLIKTSRETTSYNKRQACKNAAMAIGCGSTARRVRQIYAAYMYGDNHPIALR